MADDLRKKKEWLAEVRRLQEEADARIAESGALIWRFRETIRKSRELLYRHKYGNDPGE